MTPAELRELADKAEQDATENAFEATNAEWSDERDRYAKKANRLFLMARNLRQRASEIEWEVAKDRADELVEAHREAARDAGIARNI